MKFTAAVVLIALLAASANASGLWGAPVANIDISGHGLLGHGWLGNGLVAGHGLAVGHGLVAGHGLAVGHGLIGHAGPTLVQGHNVLSSHHGWAGAHAAALPLAHGHAAGSYVAANRGSVHVAPLNGHIQSASSINLAPAPGTTW